MGHEFNDLQSMTAHRVERILRKLERDRRKLERWSETTAFVKTGVQERRETTDGN